MGRDYSSRWRTQTLTICIKWNRMPLQTVDEGENLIVAIRTEPRGSISLSSNPTLSNSSSLIRTTVAGHDSKFTV